MTIFNVGVTPSSLIISKDGKKGYVTNANNYEIPGSDSVTVLDLETRLPILTIFDPSFVEPYRSGLTRDGKKLYVANSGSDSLTVIDTKSNAIINVIKGFDGPSGLALTKRRAYINNYGASGGLGSGNGKSISVLDLETEQIITTIIVPLAPSAITLSKDKKYLYVISYVDGQPGTGVLTVIKTRNYQIVTSIKGFSGPFGITIVKDYAYVTNFGSNDFAPYGTTVSVVDLNKYQIIKIISVGIQPSGICSNGKYVFISNYNALYAKSGFQNLTYGEGTINIIDTKTNNVIAPTIPIGETPSYLATYGNKVYATNYVQNTVRTISFNRLISLN